MPKISVIVPVYKVEPYIRRCVDSILVQSYTDIELVLVDDGSPDNCGSICDDYAEKDSRIHVIHQKNRGLSAARNAGLDWTYANSDCEWITFVDSDDWIHPNFLELLYQNACFHNCLLSAGVFFITSGEPLPEQSENAHKRMTADDYYCTEKYGGHQVTACGKLYHSSLFRNLRFPVGKLHEDEFTTYRVVYAAANVAVTNAPIYAYYKNQAGIMGSTWSPRRLDALEALQEQIAYAKEKNISKLFSYSTDSYVWNMTNQIQEIRNAISQNEAYVEYETQLVRDLRKILKDGFQGKKYPFNRRYLKMFEVAYPSPVWEALHCIYRGIKSILQR